MSRKEQIIWALLIVLVMVLSFYRGEDFIYPLGMGEELPVWQEPEGWLDYDPERPGYIPDPPLDIPEPLPPPFEEWVSEVVVCTPTIKWVVVNDVWI